MKLVCKFEKLTYTREGSVEITLTSVQRTAAEKLAAFEGAPLDVSFDKHAERRTLRANAYMWTLLNELANKLSDRGMKPVKAEDIYIEYVRDYGRNDRVYVRKDAVNAFCRGWRAQGQGWIAIPQRSKGEMVEVQVFYGSSVYTRGEMARLIDAVVADCKEQGIDTRTPEELAKMLSYMEAEEE